eukprot:m.217506 g.217506  ORF g.217506 m.217506 type:complete len:263 (-) comp25690_c0_seq3:5102-5890(-)
MAKNTAEPLLCDAFAMTFRVKFTHFKNDFPMLVTSENGALQCHGFGPAYGGDRGRIGLYIYTKTRKGPHGRGITGTASGEGWIKSVPLRTGVWHNIRIVKTRRTLSIAVDNDVVEETIPDSMSDSDFDMKEPGRTVVGGGAEARHVLHGTLTEFAIESVGPAETADIAPPPYDYVVGKGAAVAAAAASASPPSCGDSDSTALVGDRGSMTLLQKAERLQKHLGLPHAPLQETATAAAAVIGVDVTAYSVREQIDRLMAVVEG